MDAKRNSRDSIKPSVLSATQELNSIMIQRALLADLEQKAHSRMPPLANALEEFWVNIPLSDGWISRALIVRPRPITVETLRSFASMQTRIPFHERPLFINFHAGGFAAGSPIQLSLWARLCAEHFNATVIAPSYRLAPEYPWPQAMRDGMELVQLIISNSVYHYGAHPDQGLILAGVSAGACIAAVVAGLTSSDPSTYPLVYPLTGLYLSIGVYLVDSIVPPKYKASWTSHEENEHITGLESIAVNTVFTKLRDKDFCSPWFSPVNILVNKRDSAKENSDLYHKILALNHPPTYLQAAGRDPLRDDTLILEKLLREAGILTKLHLFPYDGHVSLYTLHLITGSKSENPNMMDGTIEGLEWLCGQRHLKKEAYLSVQ